MNTLIVRDLRIDLDRVRVWRRGEVVPLTRTEFRMLCCLAENPGKVQDPRYLMEMATERSFDDYAKANDEVKVYVRRLRLKLGKDTIATQRGFGYVIDEAAS